jgi:hypothetical protein
MPLIGLNFSTIMQTFAALYISCTLAVLFQILRWFGTTAEYLIGITIVVHQLSLAHRLRKNQTSSPLSTTDKTFLVFALAYHAIISGIDAYSLGQVLYGNAVLFGAGTWMWAIMICAPIALQASFGIAECALLAVIMRTSSGEEHYKVREVHLPITSPLVSRFPAEKF